MVLVKGDKIKQIKEINGFNQIGMEFEVLDINVGVITFQSNIGRGVMSYDEFEKYFEKVVEETWSEWINTEDFNYRIKGMLIECKFNDNIHTFAKCLPEDTFDLETGLKICKTKHKVIKLQKELNEF